MPGSSDLIQKPAVFQRFADQSRTPQWRDNPDFQNALAILTNPALADLDALQALAMSPHMTPGEQDHFKRHWLGVFGANDAYWPNLQPKVTFVIRNGMRRVCQRFNEQPRPSDYYWVFSGDTTSTVFKITLAEGADSRTVLFHTPVPRYLAKLRDLVDSSDLWIVGQDVNGNLEDRPVRMPTGIVAPQGVAY